MELDEGHSIPLPSKIEILVKQQEFKGWIFGVVDVPEELLSGKAQRTNSANLS